MDNLSEKDALWDLLGRARRTEASPYFARKVLRAVRESGRQTTLSLSALLRWLIPVTACVAVAIGWSAYQWQQEQAQAEFNAYFDSAADLQSLVAQEDGSLWVDEARF